MSFNDQLDEQAADLRDVQAEPVSPPEIPKTNSAGNKHSLSQKEIIIFTIVALAIMAAIYYMISQKLSLPSPIAHPTRCPNGQPLPPTPPCPQTPTSNGSP
jgi:hypothetical protein